MADLMHLPDSVRCSRKKTIVTVEVCLEDYFQGNWRPDKRHRCYKCKDGADLRDCFGHDRPMPERMRVEDDDEG